MRSWLLYSLFANNESRREEVVAFEPLKPVDVVVALRLAETPEAKYQQLSDDLGISASWAHAAVRRLQAAGLLRPGSRVVNGLTLREFLEHGLRYAFPAHPGAEARGVPTAHSGPPLAARVVAEDRLVWPSASGPTIGRAVAPLYERATELPRRCPSVYESLTLVDALRVGRARERKLAGEDLARRLAAAS
jgi:DNA-binding Lrp family transcriptional regulator